MCTGLLRVAAGTPESAVGCDGTLWGTSDYPQKCGAHRSDAVEMNMCTVDSDVALVILASEYPVAADKPQSQL